MGVKQGCILSPFLFIIGIVWIMNGKMWNDQEEKGSTLTWSNWTGDNKYFKKIKKRRRRKGVQWTFANLLEYLDFADDIRLLFHRYIDIQAKTRDLTTTEEKTGLRSTFLRQCPMNQLSSMVTKLLKLITLPTLALR